MQRAVGFLDDQPSALRGEQLALDRAITTQRHAHRFAERQVEHRVTARHIEAPGEAFDLAAAGRHPQRSKIETARQIAEAHQVVGEIERTRIAHEAEIARVDGDGR